MSGYKYLGSWVSEGGKSEKEVNSRIAMAKGAFWKLKDLLKGNVNMTTRKRLLNCYMFSVLKYGWTPGQCMKV